MEENVLSGGVEMLYTIKESLLELEGYQQKSKELASDEAALEKELSSKEKLMNDEITSLTKKRREEIEDSFDQQTEQLRTRLKKVRAKKDKQKDAGISERIKIETAELYDEKRTIKEEIKSVFKNNNISQMFNNTFYYTLFLPRCVKDILIIILTILVTLFLLPYGIYSLLFPDSTFYLCLSYGICVILFGGAYLAVSHITKVTKEPAVLQQIKGLRSRLAGNQKKIIAIIKAIKNDKDESSYGLEEFTKEIKVLDAEILEVSNEKKKALDVFESATKHAIADEIKERQRPALDSVKQQCDKVYKEQKIADDKAQQFSLEISSKYEPYIGKDIMTVGMISKLIEIIESGAATNISGAISSYKTEQSAK